MVAEIVRVRPEDIDEVVAIVKEGRRASILSDFTPSDDIIRRTVIGCTRSPNVFLRVSKHNGKVRGIICGVITPSLDLVGDTATDLIYYGDDRGLSLLNAFIQWAFGFDSVLYVNLNISIGGELAERTEKLYLTKGFEKTGACFIVRRTK